MKTRSDGDGDDDDDDDEKLTERRADRWTLADSAKMDKNLSAG